MNVFAKIRRRDCALFAGIFISLSAVNTGARSGVRNIAATSCDLTRINVGLGMTTQLIFDEAPKVTLYADKTHFKISTNDLSPRSLAIIPYVDASEVKEFHDASGRLPAPDKLAADLDKSFSTNLYVFFGHDNQLMFQLHFAPKNKADNIVKVKELFKPDCVL